MNKDYLYLWKINLVGSSHSKKTMVIAKIMDYRNEDENTIGLEFATKKIKYRNKWIKFQLWDTAGSEAFKSITKSQYRNANGIFFVYDVGNESSFNELGKHLS
jgi:small GTP-binding protein